MGKNLYPLASTIGSSDFGLVQPFTAFHLSTCGPTWAVILAAEIEQGLFSIIAEGCLACARSGLTVKPIWIRFGISKGCMAFLVMGLPLVSFCLPYRFEVQHTRTTQSELKLGWMRSDKVQKRGFHDELSLWFARSFSRRSGETTFYSKCKRWKGARDGEGWKLEAQRPLKVRRAEQFGIPNCCSQLLEDRTVGWSRKERNCWWCWWWS